MQEAAEKRIRDMQELQRMEKEQLNFKRMREDAERAEEDEFKRQVGVVLLMVSVQLTLPGTCFIKCSCHKKEQMRMFDCVYDSSDN